ncbi:replication initiator protein A [Deinococcus hopiensis]|uniref:Plasmid replication initiator protein n=1 Tax=Deinococcus hopiensis KR-140 TaxID=695939 RepID=A0A1W1UIG2_9DEIO|nr:replication initiator protein A [Deinococcus hopiensis]SMB80611.1 Plasmid replication initiator protein [Deinococcus hopiensis KR-140]
MTEKEIKRFDELNIARLSLISVQERIPVGYRDWSVELEDGDRRYRVTCQAMPEYGVPHGIDTDITAALVNLYIDQGAPTDGTVTCTPYQLLQMAGLDTSGRYYAALDESLRRLTTTNYFIAEGWRDHPRKRWTNVNFRYIDRLEFSSGEAERLDASSILKITLPQEIARSVRSGFIKPLDLSFMQTLKRPPTRALYRLLDAQRRDPENPEQVAMSYEVGLMEWAEACKIITDRPSLAVRTLDAAHEELIEKGFLKSVEYLGRGKKKLLHYTFGEAFIPPDPLLMQGLTDIGITPTRALQLVREHGEALIADTFTRYQAIVAEGYKPRSRPAFFVDLLKNPGKYMNPEVPVAVSGGPYKAQQDTPQGKRPRKAPQAPSRPSQEERDLEADTALRALPREGQVEEVMRTLTFLLRNDLKLTELDTLRLALDEGLEDPLDVKAWVLRGISSGQKGEMIRELRARLSLAPDGPNMLF